MQPDPMWMWLDVAYTSWPEALEYILITLKFCIGRVSRDNAVVWVASPVPSYPVHWSVLLAYLYIHASVGTTLWSTPRGWHASDIRLGHFQYTAEWVSMPCG